jgi:tetratricopeptide (TPR) repeat protein
MAGPFSILVRTGFLFGALMALTSFAAAQTAHCFNNLNGPEVPCTSRGGGGGSYSAPVYRGPSPAEIARRRRVKAGNAANDRGIAALKRGDYPTAVRELEEAMHLRPNDRTIHGNYWFAKGLAAFDKEDFASAVESYRESLRYNSDAKERKILLGKISWSTTLLEEKKAKEAQEAGDWDTAVSHWNETYRECIRGKALDCDWRLVGSHFALGGQALSRQDWPSAARELDKFYSDLIALMRKAIPGDKENEQLAVAFDTAHHANQSLANGNLAAALLGYENAKKIEREHNFTPTRYNPITAEIGRQIARQETLKSEVQRKEQASNPNYPNPPPVYRDANTPRDYPDLASYTPAQHHAHNDNDMGNVWAQKGDWVQAMLSYQKALVEDPDGPFSKVIKENLDIATKHLKDTQQKAATAPAIPLSPQAKPEAPKEISASNCTGWMMANGKSSRLCMDAQAHRYCEEADGKGAVSRVSCQ